MNFSPQSYLATAALSQQFAANTVSRIFFCTRLKSTMLVLEVGREDVVRLEGKVGSYLGSGEVGLRRDQVASLNFFYIFHKGKRSFLICKSLPT